jgi:hypothetical protein
MVVSVGPQWISVSISTPTVKTHPKAMSNAWKKGAVFSRRSALERM